MEATSPTQISPLKLKTLVLNADFNPISTWPLSLISAQDAICAVVRDRVTVVAEWDAEFRSPSVRMKVPRVIALKDYQTVSASPKFCRRSILLRDRFQCQYCGETFPPEQLTFDHVIPRSAGGRTEWENILTCCVPCNTRKRDTMPNYSGKKGKGSMRPLKEPRRPSSAELMRAGLANLDSDTKKDFSSWLYWNTELEA